MIVFIAFTHHTQYGCMGYKPVSHQSYNGLAEQFSVGVRPCSRSQIKLLTSCGFSLNEPQLYDTHTIVLRSHARLSQDGLTDLQNLQVGCESVV